MRVGKVDQVATMIKIEVGGDDVADVFGRVAETLDQGLR